MGAVILLSLVGCNLLPLRTEFLKVQFVGEPAKSWCQLVSVSVERFERVVASVELTPADQAPGQDTAWSFPLQGGEGYFVTATCFKSDGTTNAQFAGYRNEGGFGEYYLRIRSCDFFFTNRGDNRHPPECPETASFDF